MHELEKLINDLKDRDNSSLHEMSMFGHNGIEDRLLLADCRATDALAAICILARYIMKQEDTQK